MIRAAFLGALGATFATGGLEPTPTPSPSPLGAAAGAGAPLRVLLGEARETPATLDDASFAFGGKRYRGRAQTTALPDGRSVVVANVDVETYLAGVLPLEASSGWPPAALQAQAIVARTYALARRNPARAYDVVSGSADQVWGGIDTEKPATNAAVAATRGRIVTYAGGPASVFYSACCGGHTADATAMWGRANLPYLRGVADPHCTTHPDYRWHLDVALDRFLGALGALAAPAGTPASFSLDDPDGSGRARTLTIVGSSGRASIPIAQIRRALGYESVRSPWIAGISLDTAQAPPRVAIEGAGRGHGVGLCQWGARGMALDGADASAIVGFYFPGTVIGG